MTTRFLLLNPINPIHDMGITVAEFKEALTEFGCESMLTHSTNGNTVYYIIAPSKAALSNLCTATELPGIAVEYTAVYDQFVEV
jgi:hypothetical protein